MDFSTEKLLTIARKYWRADREYDGKLESPPEYMKLCDLWDERLEKDLDRWRACLDTLKPLLPGYDIRDGTMGPAASAFRGIAYLDDPQDPSKFRFALVACLSVLAPIYTVYGVQYDFVGRQRHNPRVSFEPLPPEMRAPADIISRRLEETFDVRRLPREVADTPIPLYVHNMEPPQTTLFHALFDSQPDNLP
ncbi:hypothetical protein JY651_33840 [Pyxidicoccus parkwayensis]|uniref:Uncharacterized protein n=1 Tax=Pyxidicoccus parkwayensis TaxID=2813578 RepID=A0ABX7NMY2_9BACT|nr:hypothetical protein [Pyxidicoccus parkwaysis]QSQ20220.1 hypothetical protein JY651_33840 [Pyxidicoccus parkwaysis]